MKPMREVLPSVSRRNAVKIGPKKGTCVATSCIGFNASMSARDRNGLRIFGPFFSTMVKSTPKAGNGVKMSLNMITPSTPNDRHGCNDNSIAISGVSDRCRNGYFSLYCRKSAMYRPACRINHTGVRSTFSPLYARTKMSASALLGGAAVFTAAAALLLAAVDMVIRDEEPPAKRKASPLPGNTSNAADNATAESIVVTIWPARIFLKAESHTRTSRST